MPSPDPVPRASTELYPALLGERWASVPLAVQRVHLGGRSTGAVEVVRGEGLVARLVSALGAETAITRADAVVPDALRWLLFAMGVGVALSGLRDAYAAFGRRGGPR